MDDLARTTFRAFLTRRRRIHALHRDATLTSHVAHSRLDAAVTELHGTATRPREIHHESITLTAVADHVRCYLPVKRVALRERVISEDGMAALVDASLSEALMASSNVAPRIRGSS